jgi:hypothetical protein
MARWQTHRSDANAKEIIAAWEAVGATVERIGRPVDVAVGFRGRDYLFEIKTAKGKLRASQVAFLARWRGNPNKIIRSVDEGLVAIGARPPEAFRPKA